MKEEDRAPSWSCLGGQSIWRPRRQNHTPYILNVLILFFLQMNAFIKQRKLRNKTVRVWTADQCGIDSTFAHVSPNCVHVASVQCHHGYRQIYLLYFHLGGQKMLPSEKKRDFTVIFSHQKNRNAFYICDHFHITGKFQMPLNYLFFCFFFTLSENRVLEALFTHGQSDS